MNVSSKKIAEFLGVEHFGPEQTITGVDLFGRAGSSDLTYTQSFKKKPITETEAGVVICPPPNVDEYESTILISRFPKADFSKAVDHFYCDTPERTEIHPTAVVEEGATIGEQCVIGPQTYITEDVEIGDNCIIQSGVSIGESGWGWGRDQNGNIPIIPHLSGVKIGDNVTIGSNTVIDRGIFNDTVVQSGSIIVNLVHVAHECKIGKNAIIDQFCSIAGSVSLKNCVKLQPCVAVATGVTVGSGSEVGMNSTVLDDIPPHTKAVGTPATVIDDDWCWWQ